MSWVDSIKNYIPCNDQEKNDKKIILKSIYKFNDILTRDNGIIHISVAYLIEANTNK